VRLICFSKGSKLHGKSELSADCSGFDAPDQV